MMISVFILIDVAAQRECSHRDGPLCSDSRPCPPAGPRLQVRMEEFLAAQAVEHEHFLAVCREALHEPRWKQYKDMVTILLAMTEYRRACAFITCPYLFRESHARLGLAIWDSDQSHPIGSEPPVILIALLNRYFINVMTAHATDDDDAQPDVPLRWQ